MEGLTFWQKYPDKDRQEKLYQVSYQSWYTMGTGLDPNCTSIRIIDSPVEKKEELTESTLSPKREEERGGSQINNSADPLGAVEDDEGHSYNRGVVAAGVIALVVLGVLGGLHLTGNWPFQASKV